IEMLFDRFYKKDTSRSNINSTGLGLSIAKSLMELMDGDIEAKIVNDRIYIKCIWTILNSN
ncbi:MAG: ATP-binding protein, partial [Paraclostridium sp.]